MAVNKSLINQKSEVNFGSSGSTVKKLQEELNSNGYDIAEDGIFGKETSAAVKDYQANNGLVVDGIVGEKTWASLDSGNSSASSTSTKSSTNTSTSTKPKTYSTVDLSKYNSGYQKSEDVINAENKKTEAESAVNNYGDFSYSNDAAFKEIMDKILNKEKFSYDLNGDALYQQYKDKYIQQGKMAMQDTMGQAAAMTGGYGNSYAASVGNQAYQASLDNLNDIIPELYQMALDQYNQEKQDLYNQYGMLSDDRNMEYAQWGNKYNQLVADRDYYGNEANNAYAKDYGEYNDAYNRDFNQYWNETNYGYQQDRDSIADQQWQAQFDEAQRQYNASLAEQQRQYNESMALSKEQFAYQKEQAEKSSGSGNTLWYDTGTTDDNGNKIFRNSEGKTMAFGEGTNPYTGTKNKDILGKDDKGNTVVDSSKVFSNGYQPNNINGTKLTNSGMSTSITGKEQTIWEANGKYWLWRGDLNKYIEVDISNIDE